MAAHGALISLTAAWLARKEREFVPQACPPAPFRGAGPHAWLHWLEPMKWSWRHYSSCCITTGRMRGHTHTCNRAPTSLSSAATRLQEIFQECVDKGCWARLVRETTEGVETCIVSWRIRTGGPGTRGDVRHGQRKEISHLSLESLQQQQHHYQQQQQQPHCYVVFILVIHLFLIPSHYRK